VANAKVSDGWRSSNSQITKRVTGQPFAPPSGSLLLSLERRLQRRGLLPHVENGVDKRGVTFQFVVDAKGKSLREHPLKTKVFLVNPSKKSQRAQI
jgi:hypothetical protein